MSQSPPGLKLGFFLELVMFSFEMNSEMPSDFRMRKAPQLIARVTFIWTPPVLVELIGSGVSNGSGTGTGAFVTN